MNVWWHTNKQQLAWLKIKPSLNLHSKHKKNPCGEVIQALLYKNNTIKKPQNNETGFLLARLFWRTVDKYGKSQHNPKVGKFFKSSEEASFRGWAREAAEVSYPEIQDIKYI